VVADAVRRVRCAELMRLWNVGRRPSDEVTPICQAHGCLLGKCIMVDSKNSDEPVTVTADEARGALSPGEGSSGDTLMPMLIGGLVLIVVAVIIVMIFV
jgi:hypothetical protein